MQAALFQFWTTEEALKHEDRSDSWQPRIIESAGEPLSDRNRQGSQIRSTGEKG
jgi:hypothetical protein